MWPRQWLPSQRSRVIVQIVGKGPIALFYLPQDRAIYQSQLRGLGLRLPLDEVGRMPRHQPAALGA